MPDETTAPADGTSADAADAADDALIEAGKRQLAAYRESIAQTRESQATQVKSRDELIVTLSNSGVSPRELYELAGISHQRLSQILDDAGKLIAPKSHWRGVPTRGSTTEGRPNAEARAQRDAQIGAMHDSGLPIRLIAPAVGLSEIRVRQILAERRKGSDGRRGDQH